MKEINKNNEIIIFQAKSGAIEFRADVKKETLWATQAQMAAVFGINSQAITKHLKNIYLEGELTRLATCSKMEQVQIEGSRRVSRTVEIYNLDVIISVGYRIGSKTGTKFRKWATKVLRSHIVDGYTINEKRLKSGTNAKYLELRKAVDLLGNLVSLDSVTSETRGVVQVISEYAHALDLLDDYDYQRLVVPLGTRKETFKITPNVAREIIEAVRVAYGGSSLMGIEKDKGLYSALGALYQTFGGKEVYHSVEEKAAHLLYFITKNHCFVDGNKRIAAALFVCYLDKNGLLFLKAGTRRISDITLVALTLLIAASKPQEKDMMIKVILNLMSSGESQ
jgi:prophage maintenance system killer protein